MSPALVKEDHQRCQRENRHEEEQIVANNRADQGHFFTARRKHAIFGKLVQSGNKKLSRNEDQNDRCYTKETTQIDAYAAFYEHHTKDDCQQHADYRSHEAQELGRVELDGCQNQDCFHTLAQHH